MKEIILGLKKRLSLSINKHSSSGLLFSGGLDTSILAALNPDVKAISVSLCSFGEDIRYANLVAKCLKLEYFHRGVHIDEAIDSIPEVIRILRTFDPAIPNDIAVYFGLKEAKEKGVLEMMTGDGSDELFAGYSFMRDIKNLGGYIRTLSSNLSFSSNEIGKFLGIEIKQPYLDKDVLNFALSIPREFKIKQENGKSWGKWILRKAFEDTLPKEVIWQDKRPLECGSGMSRLREIISLRISDNEFNQKCKEYPVRFMNKEHLYYYEIYRKLFGDIPKPKANQKGCPGCSAEMRKESFHCRVCGWTRIP